MALRTRAIGPISAYAIAVSKGYTGTEEEFAQEIANASTNAATAEASAEQVQELVNDLPSSFTALLEELDDTQKMVSPLYIPGVAIAAGEYKVKDGYLYKCNTAVSAESNTSWDAVSQYFDPVNVGGELVVLEDTVRRVWSDEIKLTLLSCMRNVAWSNQYGQDYYDALYAALNPPEDLSYIAAVYTQSGTVYTTDSLESLRSGLVVTAHYLGGESSRIYGYVLSGTFTEGISTITVTYGGKNTTFEVTVTDATLIYALSSPITFTGQWSETVDTGVKAMPTDRDTTFLIDFTPDDPASNNGNYLFYAGLAASPYNAVCIRCYNTAGTYSKPRVETHSSGSGFSIDNLTYGQPARVVIRYTAGASTVECFCKASGTIITGTSSNTGIVADATMRLGGATSSLNRYKGVIDVFKVYSRKLTDDEVYAFLNEGV